MTNRFQAQGETARAEREREPGRGKSPRGGETGLLGVREAETQAGGREAKRSRERQMTEREVDTVPTSQRMALAWRGSWRGASPVCPAGLHGPGQFPGREGLLQFLLGSFCDGLDVPLSIFFLLLRGPPRHNPGASVAKGSSTGELIQHRRERRAWGRTAGAGSTRESSP